MSAELMLMYLDTNTQIQHDRPSEDDPIRSFTASKDSVEFVPNSQPDISISNGDDERLDCECGVNVSEHETAMHDMP